MSERDWRLYLKERLQFFRMRGLLKADLEKLDQELAAK